MVLTTGTPNVWGGGTRMFRYWSVWNVIVTRSQLDEVVKALKVNTNLLDMIKELYDHENELS